MLFSIFSACRAAFFNVKACCICCICCVLIMNVIYVAWLDLIIPRSESINFLNLFVYLFNKACLMYICLFLRSMSQTNIFNIFLLVFIYLNIILLHEHDLGAIVKKLSGLLYLANLRTGKLQGGFSKFSFWRRGEKDGSD